MNLTIPVEQHDHIWGPAAAPITLVEYGDYECPFCGAAYPMINALVDSFEPDLQFVFRHMPLSEMHPHAELKAEAAEAASAQEKFWEMHDALFQHQSVFAPELIFNLAREIQLDLRRFSDDLLKRRYRNRVTRDVNGGICSGVMGTPTFFIDGVRYGGNLVRPDGELDVDSLRTAVQRALRSFHLLPDTHCNWNDARSEIDRER